MQINISRLARADGLDPFDYSRSIAEYGERAGPDGWSNAVRDGIGKPPLIRRRHCPEVRDYFEGYGAWSRAELAAWTWADCAAVVLQHASGDLREAQACCPGRGVAGIDWSEYRRQSEAGRVNGNMHVSGGKLFIDLSN